MCPHARLAQTKRRPAERAEDEEDERIWNERQAEKEAAEEAKFLEQSENTIMETEIKQEANTIPFGAALEVVKARFTEEVRKIQTAGNNRGRVSFAVQSCGGEIEADFFANGDGTDCSMCKTLEDAVATIPSKFDEIARLRRQIAALEGGAK